jgi:HIP---CoA ligase
MGLPETIPQVVRAAATTFGGLEAVVDGDRRMSFSEIADRVEVLERSLIGSGVEAGDRVGIWAPNSLDWILLSFAIYGVGGILVPINTRYKGDEAADILETAGVDLLFTVTDFLGADYLSYLRGSRGLGVLREIVVFSGAVPSEALSLEDFVHRGELVTSDDARAREEVVGVEDPSDIIFTSGTTGLPKGAVLRHGASVETYRQWSRGVGIEEGDRMVMVYPFFHTAGLKSGVLASFLRGATLIPFPVFESQAVAELIEREKITVLPGPPSVFQSLLGDPGFDTFALDSLRLSVTGAAVVPVELIARMRDELHLDSVITAYGLTETHGTVTLCETNDSIETIATTVGHPLEGLELAVVDDEGTELPVGEAGEILVRGFNLMTGYVGDPGATAKAIDDEGWLHTGDVGYLGTEGYLRIVDRKKDIIIVGGFNVSPAEVESILLRRAEITQVAVVGLDDDRLGEVGVAFVMLREGQKLEAGELGAWCREHMANFKVPRFFAQLDKLPLNPSGKVLKRELRMRAQALFGTR